ncbi:FAD-dependent pyridine nucleotide-disulfide oxidoreductase [uncultured Paludibacter sp.]|nr:FAD-dependent pyridine nucleotide-disulfide oxidoreductase [uncultured Paludibacter sp.]
MINFKPNDRIVIIGGGFAGIQLIKKLKNKPLRLTLVDKQNFHSFQPLLYQVASARVEPASISFPFRKLFQGYKNFDYRMASVERIDKTQKCVVTDNGNIKYDHLVIATGCTTNFFGNEDLRKYALPMKEMSEAINIRNRILMDFEAYATASLEDKEKLMNIIIVGAGATGVELSGAFAELKNDVLPKDYPKVDFSGLDIYLLEGGPNTLNNMSDDSKKMSREYLEKLGVRVKTGVTLQSYDGNNAVLSTGETIPCKNLIWSAGVTGNILEGVTEKENIIRNRYIVDRYNLVKNTENIYALGDIAYMETPLYPKGHPQVANVAINQAKNLAKNIIYLLKGKPLNAYEYKDLGMMATIGKNKAVVDLKHLSFQGTLAWLTWMFLHLMLILSARNKLIIFINWAWAYITKDTSLRLIINPKKSR